MEGHDRQTAAILQDFLRRPKARLEFRQLFIHSDPKSLKGSGRRMHLCAPPTPKNAFNECGEIQSAGEGLLSPTPANGGGDATGLSLLAIDPEYPRQILEVGGVHDIRRRLSRVAHPHIQGAVPHE